MQLFLGSAPLFPHCMCTLLAAPSESTRCGQQHTHAVRKHLCHPENEVVNNYSVSGCVYSLAFFIYSKQFSSHSSHFFSVFQFKTTDDCSMLSMLGYSWIGRPKRADEKSIYRRTRRVTSLLRPPLESFRRGEFRSDETIFV